MMQTSLQKPNYEPVLTMEMGPNITNIQPKNRSGIGGVVTAKSAPRNDQESRETRPLTGGDIEIVYIADKQGTQSKPILARGETRESSQGGEVCCDSDCCDGDTLELVCTCICGVLFCGLPFCFGE